MTTFKTRITGESKVGIISANHMKPGQIGVVVDSQYKGTIIMRSASQYENNYWFNLSDCSKSNTWSNSCGLKVELLKPGTKLELIVDEDNI